MRVCEFLYGDSFTVFTAELLKRKPAASTVNAPPARDPSGTARTAAPMLLGWFMLLFAVWLAIGPASAQQAGLQPGEAYVTRFSGSRPSTDSRGQPGFAIDLNGVVGSIIDIRAPGQPPRGDHWINEPQRNPVTAAEVGQVFGVVLDDATPPNIYVSATSAFGLHLRPGTLQWMPGMWGAGGGPGTIYRLDAANDYRPRVFSHITLNNRQNTGAALGNMAFDPAHKQLLVSDLETGMIHRVRATDGVDLGYYDHGTQGRARFLDVATGQSRSLPPIGFDPSTRARVADCPTGDFEHSPECWNVAPSGRRVWGLGVRQDPRRNEVRLYYAVWSSPALGNAAWSSLPDDEKRNSIWSVRLGPDGAFDVSDIRREFLLPDFFVKPEDIARAGHSQPVSDISFSTCGDRNVMLVAERGGLRNLGLGAEDAFATPHEARTLRYELDANRGWQLIGRYDIGFYDRKGEGQPYIRANCAGGAAFGFGYAPDTWSIDRSKPDQTTWMSGDVLCSPYAPCFNAATGRLEDGSEVHGIQGTPDKAFVEVQPQAALRDYPASGPAYPPTGPLQSYMIDTDRNVGADGQVDMDSLLRNDATRIGDLVIYQPCITPAAELPVPVTPPAPPPLPPAAPPTEPPPSLPPDLSVEKAQTQWDCLPGGLCTFTIWLTNRGPGVWVGIPRIIDTLPPGAVAVNASPPWVCTPVGTEVICEYPPTVLNPGESIPLTLTVQLPPDFVTGTFNCVRIDYPPGTFPDPESHRRHCLHPGQYGAAAATTAAAGRDGTAADRSSAAARAALRSRGGKGAVAG